MISFWLPLFCYFYFLLSISASKRPSLLLIDGFNKRIRSKCQEFCTKHDMDLLDLTSPSVWKRLVRKGEPVPYSLRSPDSGDMKQWIDCMKLPSTNDQIRCTAGSLPGLSIADVIENITNPVVNTNNDTDIIHPILFAQKKHLLHKLLSKQRVDGHHQHYHTLSQLVTSNWTEAKTFLSSYLTNTTNSSSQVFQYPFFLRPDRSIAFTGQSSLTTSSPLFLCHTLAQAESAFHTIYGKPRDAWGLEGVYDQVWIQPAATTTTVAAAGYGSDQEGKEYLVDVVSTEGIEGIGMRYEVMSIWEKHMMNMNGGDGWSPRVQTMRLLTPHSDNDNDSDSDENKVIQEIMKQCQYDLHTLFLSTNNNTIHTIHTSHTIPYEGSYQLHYYQSYHHNNSNNSEYVLLNLLPTWPEESIVAYYDYNRLHHNTIHTNATTNSKVSFQPSYHTLYNTTNTNTNTTNATNTTMIIYLYAPQSGLLTSHNGYLHPTFYHWLCQLPSFLHLHLTLPYHNNSNSSKIVVRAGECIGYILLSHNHNDSHNDSHSHIVKQDSDLIVQYLQQLPSQSSSDDDEQERIGCYLDYATSSTSTSTSTSTNTTNTCTPTHHHYAAFHSPTNLIAELLPNTTTTTTTNTNTTDSIESIENIAAIMQYHHLTGNSLYSPMYAFFSRQGKVWMRTLLLVSLVYLLSVLLVIMVLPVFRVQILALDKVI